MSRPSVRSLLLSSLLWWDETDWMWVGPTQNASMHFDLEGGFGQGFVPVDEKNLLAGMTNLGASFSDDNVFVCPPLSVFGRMVC